LFLGNYYFVSSSVEQIKERLGIVDVVLSYIKLDKAGRNFRARCPFHNEKTPSFFVSPERNTYHCFGCSSGGDIFSFVQNIEGISFREALEHLAERSGVRLVAENPRIKKDKEILFAIMEASTEFFEKKLNDKPEVSAYLHDRGLSKESIENFRVGYIPDGWRALTDFLAERGYNITDIEKAGLLIKNPRGHYDRFRGRIMFPIADSYGRTIAFSGRVYGEEGTTMGGKYINSPETLLYNKSKVLYGYYPAKQEIRTRNECVLVEGQLDVILSHQSGATHTVAPCGTALTEHHITLISRLADTIVCAFDADTAGIAASGRSIDLALSKGINVKLIKIDSGKDPAQVIQENKVAWNECVKNARHVIDFYLAVLKDAGHDTRTLRKKAEKLVLPYIAALPSKLEQAHFIKETARTLSLGEEPVWDALRELMRVRVSSVTPISPATFTNQSSDTDMTHKNRRTNFLARMVGIIEMLSRSDKIPKNVAKEMEEQIMELCGKSLTELKDEVGHNLVEKINFEIEDRDNTSEELTEEFNNLAVRLKEFDLRQLLIIATENLKKAEECQDKESIDKTLEECEKIRKELQTHMERSYKNSRIY
jgi:DNA primase